jgi:hypothetical protein
MNILVARDGSPDSQSALTYGIGQAIETRGKLTVVHVHQRRQCGSEQVLQDSLRCFDSVRASINDHGSVVPASAVFMTITDHNDMLTYAANAQIDLIAAPHAFDELFCKACGHVVIISGDEGQLVNS